METSGKNKRKRAYHCFLCKMKQQIYRKIACLRRVLHTSFGAHFIWCTLHLVHTSFASHFICGIHFEIYLLSVIFNTFLTSNSELNIFWVSSMFESFISLTCYHIFVLMYFVVCGRFVRQNFKQVQKSLNKISQNDMY